MERYGAKQRYRLLSKAFVSAVVFLCLVLIEGWANCVIAQPNGLPLYLQVSVNGAPTNLIVEFAQDPNGSMSTKRSELDELRIEVTDNHGPDEWVRLDSIPGLTYRYDEEEQSIGIRVGAETLSHTTLDAANSDTSTIAPTKTTGAVLNYGLYGAINEETFNQDDITNGFSAHFEGRVFGDFGVAEASVIVGAADLETVRLDTTVSRYFPDQMVSAHAGDFVTGGLIWSRPIRVAGIQIKRNFSLRPDLITKPLPTVSGSAAVPSTVDVYVNNVKTYSKSVPSGPFTINRLPVVSGNGVARVVVRDATGRETVSETPFFSAPELLAEGMLDYSVEAGFVRLNYGSKDSYYDTSPVAMASMRYGLTDKLTVTGHVEGGLGVANGGAGFVYRTGLFGALSFGASASTYDGDLGGQLYGAFHGEFEDVHLNVRSQRTFGDFTDLAAVAVDFDDVGLSSAILGNIQPARAINFASVGAPVPITGGRLNLSYLQNEEVSGDTQDIATASYTQRVAENISIYSTAFRDFSDEDNLGAYIGLSMSLGNRQSVSTSLSTDKDGSNVSANYVKTAARKPGSVGWRLRASEGEQRVAQADVEYHGSKALLRGSIAHNNDTPSGSVFLDGGIAMTKEGVFLSRRIDGPFAVVDTGAPGVEVQHENQVIGHSDDNGMILVPNLHPFQRNKITMDVNALPLNAHISDTSVVAVPEARSGTVVKFNVDAQPRAALVEFVTPNGTHVGPGFAGTLVSSGQEFVVGYDGQAYIEGLSAVNRVEIELVDRNCQAIFPFLAEQQTQVMIERVLCE